MLGNVGGWTLPDRRNMMSRGKPVILEMCDLAREAFGAQKQ